MISVYQSRVNRAVNWEDLARRILLLEEEAGVQLTSTQGPEGWKLEISDQAQWPGDVSPTIYSGQRVGEAYKIVSSILRWEKIRKAAEAESLT